MAEGQMGFIIIYLTLLLGVGLVGQWGYDEVSLSDDLTPPPTLDQSNLTIATFLVFVFDFVVYWLGFQGLAIFGIPAIVAGTIAFLMDTLFLYVIVRLIRGGG